MLTLEDAKIQEGTLEPGSISQALRVTGSEETVA